MPRAVLFDLWGTLAHAPASAGDDALRRALAAAKVERPFAEVKQAWEAAKAAADPHADADVEERFQATFRALGAKARFAKADAKAAAPRYVDELAGSLRAFPDALPALRALPESMRVGVVSNFPDARALGKALDRMGLAARVDAFACSGECGRRKPDPAPFRLALERLGAEAAETVMVGDGEDDVAGAVALGMRAIFLAREGQAPPPGAAAMVKDLGGVAALVAPT